MRILMLAQHVAPDFEGGAEVVVRAHSRALAERGHALTIVAGSDRTFEGREVVERELDGMPTWTLPRRAGEEYDLLLERPRLTRHVRDGGQRFRPDIVHVHHWSTLSSDLVRSLSTLAPVVVYLHDFFATCPRFFRTPPRAGIVCPPRGSVAPCVGCIEPEAAAIPPAERTRMLVRRAELYDAELAAAAEVLAPSQVHARRLAELFALPAGRVRVVPYGQCRALTRPERKMAAWKGERPLRVLHYGHLSAAKGTLDLVHALCTIDRAELVLLGPAEPGFERELRAAAGALKLERIAGPYGERELEHAAVTCDLAAFPSRLHESYGLVVDEALELGLPVWVGDRGALSERLSGAGRVLPAAEPRAWTAAFAQLIAAPRALESERERVPARVRGASEAARELEDIYRTAVERRAQGAQRGAR